MKIDPDSWPTWGNLAGWHLDRGQFEDAEQAARRSLEIRPLEEKNRVSGFNLASALIQTDRHDEAIPLLVKVVRAESKNVQYRLALATAYSEVGRHEKAIEQFTAALHYDSDNEIARRGIEEMRRQIQSTQPSTQPEN